MPSTTPVLAKFPTWSRPLLRLVAHLAFWFGYLLLSIVTIAGTGTLELWVYLFQLLALPIKIAVVYTVLYLLVPKVLLQKKLIAFSISLVGILLFGAALQRVFLYYALLQPLEITPQTPLWAIPPLIGELLRLTLVVFMADFIKLLRVWYLERLNAERLDELKTKAELAKLRSEVKPHFLFNTLNNMYALSLQGGQRVSEHLLRLSGFLREIVYHDGDQARPLQEELQVLDDYIALEQLRFGERLAVERNVDLTASSCCLPPLLLLPLVENAFKHGLSAVPGEVHLSLEALVDEDDFIFRVENTQPKKADRKSYDVGGQGQRNLKGRLQLSFGKAAIFHTEDRGNTYLAEIRILDFQQHTQHHGN